MFSQKEWMLSGGKLHKTYAEVQLYNKEITKFSRDIAVNKWLENVNFTEK
jgi:hypothetical protein